MKKIKFPTMFENENEKTGLDYSNPYEDVYEEIPPYTKGHDGKWLNDTSEPIIVKTGKINIQEKIDSFKDEVDIYKILERVAMSGEDISCRGNQCFDISSIPTNINDFTDYVSAHMEILQSLPKEISSLIIKDDFNQADLDLAIKNYNDKLNEEKNQVETKEEKKDGEK